MATNLKALIEDCFEGGQTWESSFRKVPAIASTAGHWSDLSGAPGNPKPNYYTGAELTATLFPENGGMYVAGDVSPATKWLSKIMITCVTAAPVPATITLCDYLLFYPLIDMDSTDTQVFDNTVTLPRYTDGVGVQAMLVATNPYLGGAAFNIDYTDTNDVAQTSALELSNLATLMSTVVNSGLVAGNGGPFIRRNGDCRGIKSVQSITFQAPNGGLAALVLVKPLVTFGINEITAPSEFEFLKEKITMPRIYDGAYVNMMILPNGSVAAAPIFGTLTSIWR